MDLTHFSGSTKKDREEKEDVEIELYYLIAKFLSLGPCKNAYKTLKEEIKELKILPKRTDWLGNEHFKTFEEYDNQNTHINKDFLLRLVKKLGPCMQELIPTYPKVKKSLLGLGSQSLLRTDKDLVKLYKNGYTAIQRHYGNPLLEPLTLKTIPNSTYLLFGREIQASINRNHFLSNKFYHRLQLLARKVGHLSAVYCMLFDRHGRYIITGADDMLVKIWSIFDGRLLATLRGASAEITDLAIDHDNTMVAAGSCDKVIRVWNLQTLAPIAVLSSHTGMITSVSFCPTPDSEGVLISTGGDGCVAFWTYVKKGRDIRFNLKPLKINERVRPGHAQLICSSFSQGGTFLAIGGADHFVRIYHLGGLEGVDKLLETEIHQDRVDSIQWCHSGAKFASGSRDGSALIWRFERQQWKTVKLDMTEVLPGVTLSAEITRKLQVTMVGWDRMDAYVITASSDRVLRVWDSHTGKLKHMLKGHEDNAYVIEAHPTDMRLILTAGHDGQLFIWDVIAGTVVKSFKNTIEGQGYGSIFDAKWSPDGFSIAATDSHGHILIYGIGHNEHFKKIPQELFFHTDYRPLVRDVNHHILDEQTQLAPHLMPPPFLVNIDGNPYPPNYQRLVPGRETCRDDQLVPNVVLNDEGEQEVLDVVLTDSFHAEPNLNSPNLESSENRPSLDVMIERLAREQDQRLSGSTRTSGGGHLVPGPSGVSLQSDNVERHLNMNGPLPDHSYAVAGNLEPLSPRAGWVGSRRVGDVEGVRQSTGNWQRDPIVKWKKRIFIKPLNDSELTHSESLRNCHGELESRIYETELRKRPELLSKPSIILSAIDKKSPMKGRRRQKKQTHAYSTRSNRNTPERGPSPEVEEREESFATSNQDEESSRCESSSESSTVEKDELLESSSSDEGSTDYSDWTAEAGVNLEPPKRTAHRQKKRPVNVKKGERSKDSDDEIEEEVKKRGRRKKEEKSDPLPSISTAPINRIRRDVKRVNMAEIGDNISDEIPEAFRPPEWLSETVSKRAPYFPQMGDEIVYFRQGHQLYVEAVINRELYQVDKRTLPWHRKQNLKDQEHVKIIGIKYEIKPPRLCCLKLGITGGPGSLSTDSFTIKYHDMADVLDFLVLKQTYNKSVARRWKSGDRFRCIIDDAWWCGEVEACEPHLPDFPDSKFMCYKVIWDNGERERLSPWDMEPIDNKIELPEHGGSVQVLSSEYQNLLYTVNIDEWDGRPYEEECARIAEGIGRIMELSAAEPFLAPVDLNVYPHYAMVVEYFIDLSTVKSRLENYFYRRPTAVQFDVRYIATNAEKFNTKGSSIVKQARIITDLCLKLIKDKRCRDPTLFYHEVQLNYQSPDHSEDELRRHPRRRRRGRVRHFDSDDEIRLNRHRSKIKEAKQDTRPWQQRCKDLLKSIFERQDSAPFRYPVNLEQYKDYNQVIDVPMDLTTIREELAAGAYSTALNFAKDVRLVFANSKNYNTNKRSRIYSMTLRLEAFFEDQIKPILSKWRTKGKTPASRINSRGRRQKDQKQSQLQHYQWQTLPLKHLPRVNIHSFSKVTSWLAQPMPRGSKKDTEGGPSTSSYTETCINVLNLNGLLSDDETDLEEDTARGSVNEGGMRRSRRVAKLRRRRGEEDDSDDLYSPTARKKNLCSPAKSSPFKNLAAATNFATKGGPFKRSQGRRYEDDSDYEIPPPPPRRNSSSSSTKTKKSRRYEDDSDFEGPPAEAIKMKLLDSSDREPSSPPSADERKEKPNENSSPDSTRHLDSHKNADNGKSYVKTKRLQSSSSEDEDTKTEPKINGFHSKIKDESSDSAKKGNRDSSGTETDSSSNSSGIDSNSKNRKIKRTIKKRRKEDSDCEDESITRRMKPKRKNESDVDNERKRKDDSEFELDEEDETEESDSEETLKTRRKPIVKNVAPRERRVKKVKKVVLDGDDADDGDFVVDEDSIEDIEHSSSESSSSSSSESETDSDCPRKRKLRKKGRKKQKNTPVKKKMTKRQVKRTKGNMKRKVNKKITNQRAKNTKDSSDLSDSETFVRPVHHKGHVIGRVILPVNMAKGDYSSGSATDSDTDVPDRNPEASDEENDPSFAPVRPTSKRFLDEEDEAFEEVGRRGRVRKRVRYAEDDSENEMASVSSRGRIRKANTRMKDFV